MGATRAALNTLAPAHLTPVFPYLQKSVDRLGRAIEAAEEEMEAALRRTADMHRSQVKQKDLEVQVRAQRPP